VRERLRRILDVCVARVLNAAGRRRGGAAKGLAQIDAVRVRRVLEIWKGPEHQPVDDAEHGRVRSDPEGERDDHRGGEPRRLPQPAERVAKVLTEIVEQLGEGWHVAAGARASRSDSAGPPMVRGRGRSRHRRGRSSLIEIGARSLESAVSSGAMAMPPNCGGIASACRLTPRPSRSQAGQSARTCRATAGAIRPRIRTRPTAWRAPEPSEAAKSRCGDRARVTKRCDCAVARARQLGARPNRVREPSSGVQRAGRRHCCRRWAAVP
jgi:hypothetical protein